MTEPSWDGEQVVREISLTLPEATEQEAWGDPTFRIRNKIFVMVKRGGGRVSAWLKSDPGVRDALIAENPDCYFIPPYVGPSGWLGVVIEPNPGRDDLCDLILQSYRQIAPKRVVKLLDE